MENQKKMMEDKRVNQQSFGCNGQKIWDLLEKNAETTGREKM